MDRRLPDEAVSQHPTKKFLSSIKSIYVTERLNEVFGVGSWRVETGDQNGEVKEYRYEIESMLPQDAEPSAVPVTITFNGNMLKVESEAIAMESPVQLMLNIDDGKELTFSVVHDSEEENFTVRPTDEKK